MRSIKLLSISLQLLIAASSVGLTAGINCNTLGPVIDGQVTTVDLLPGKFQYDNKNSPNYFIRFVLEYDEMDDFSSLPNNLESRASDLDNEVSTTGVDMDLQCDLGSGTGPCPNDDGISTQKIVAGRFVFIKDGDPLQKFQFPAVPRLQNGKTYFFRSFTFRGSDSCFAPPLADHARFPVLVVTTPPSEKVLGIASQPRRVNITAVTSTSLTLEWAPPIDSGDGTPNGILNQVTYNVTAMGSSGLSGCRQVVNHYDGSNKTMVTLTGLCKGSTYTIHVVALNTMGPSDAAVRLGRPISGPSSPANIDIVFNPNNWWNVTGNTMADVVWNIPDDTGDGAGGVTIEKYLVYRYLPVASGGAVQEDISTTFTERNLDVLPRGETMKTFAYNVSAVNLQLDDLGFFTQEGPTADVVEPLGKPPRMSVTLDSGETVFPAQAEGVSDYCKQNCSMVSCGSNCTEEVCEVTDERCSNFAGGMGCDLCAEPVVKLFIGEENKFLITAEDPLGSMSPSESISIDTDNEELSPVFAAPGVVEISTTSFEDGTVANVTIVATAAMARENVDQSICFFAETEQGLRSRLCVTVRVIKPFPEFIEPYARSHHLTLGCQFSTLMTAIDYTEERLPLQEVVAKDYLLRISYNGSTQISQYRRTGSGELPTGVMIRTPFGAPVNNSLTVRLSWTPARQQEGFTYQICLEAIGYIRNESVPSDSPHRFACLMLDVARCKFCATRTQDTFTQLAAEWRTSWLNVWSGNHAMMEADVAQGEVQLGPVLKVSRTEQCSLQGRDYLCNDDLTHIGQRYGVAVKDLLWWNPDIADEAGRQVDYRLREDQEVCVLPQTCLTDAHIYSAGY